LSTAYPRAPRVSIRLCRDRLPPRALSAVFGFAAVPAVALIGATLLRRQYAWAAAAAVVAFFVPFLVFTNLHIVHSYYQTANAIFIIAAAGLGFAAGSGTRWGGGGAGGFLLLLGGGRLLFF